MDTLNKLYIEPSTKCNLSCDMCFRHTWFDEPIQHMDMKVFKAIINSISVETKTIFFGGMGEPLCHPDILKMIALCNEKKVEVELLTNGSLLTEDVTNRLVELEVKRLWISMDEIEPTDQNGLGHPYYDTIIEKIKIFNTQRFIHKSKIKLGITFVATKKNVEQLARLPLFIDKYRISHVNISNMYPSSMEAQEETLYQKTLNMSLGSDSFGMKRPVVDIPYMDFHLPEVRNGIGGLLSKMNFNPYLSGIPIPRRSQFCPFVNEGVAFVRSDGGVAPCMALLHNGTTVIGETERIVNHHVFGNVSELGVHDIWNSKEYVAFRQRVKEFSFSHCMNCGHCNYVEENCEDCFGNQKPTCGACLWAEGLLSCP